MTKAPARGAASVAGAEEILSEEKGSMETG